MKLSFVVLLLIVCTGTALADTLNVPSQYGTIQSAIDAAVNGDTVLVAPGTYMENIDFSGKAITVESSGDPVETVIDGGGGGNVVAFYNYEGRDSVLDGFTIAGGSWYAILIDNAGPTISNNRIVDSVAAGGISCGNTYAHIKPYIFSNTIKNNAGHGIYDENGSDIIGNLIADNEGKGVFFDRAQKGIVKGNTIINNQDTGILFHYGENCSILYNTVANNTAVYGGGGVDCFNCYAEIHSNLIYGNTASWRGGGIFLSHYASCRVSNNLIWRNDAPEGGGVAMLNEAYADLYHNTIVENTATVQGGGLSVSTYSFHGDTVIDDCILWGNSAPVGDNMVINDNSTVHISHCDVEGGQSSIEIIHGMGTLNWGDGMIDTDPLFVDPVNGDFRLSQDPCQPGISNPCVDSGSQDVIYLNMQSSSTRTDGELDTGSVDMGYHTGYYRPIPFTCEPDTLSASTGGTVEFVINAEWQDLGRNYLILGSVSGVTPGHPLPGGMAVLPLNWDIFTDIALQLVNTPVLDKFMGQLASHGWTRGYMNVGPIPSAVGVDIDFAYVLNNPFDFASNPVRVSFVP